MSGAVGVGIDVGASLVHLVAATADGRVLAGDALGSSRPEEAVAWVRALGAEVRRVAIDAPAALSPGAHVGDATLAPKFRAARCGEIALGRDAGVWVPWVSPPVGATEVAGWITVGLALFDAFAEAGFDAVETFPHAVFRSLDGGARIPAKSTAAGRARRVELLRAAGLRDVTLPLWGHDGIDAAAAALVAVDAEPRVVTCGHDGSAIHLPGRRR